VPEHSLYYTSASSGNPPKTYNVANSSSQSRVSRESNRYKLFPCEGYTNVTAKTMLRSDSDFRECCLQTTAVERVVHTCVALVIVMNFLKWVINNEQDILCGRSRFWTVLWVSSRTLSRHRYTALAHPIRCTHNVITGTCSCMQAVCLLRSVARDNPSSKNFTKTDQSDRWTKSFSTQQTKGRNINLKSSATNELNANRSFDALTEN
jgi:hypothetical protein